MLPPRAAPAEHQPSRAYSSAYREENTPLELWSRPNDRQTFTPLVHLSTATQSARRNAVRSKPTSGTHGGYLIIKGLLRYLWFSADYPHYPQTPPESSFGK